MKKEAFGFGTDIRLRGLPSAAGYVFGRAQPMTDELAKKEVERNYSLLAGLLLPGYTGYHFGTRHAAGARLRELEDQDRAAQMAAQKEATDKYEKQASTAYMRYLHGLAPSEQIPTMMGVLQRATGHGYHSVQDARQWPQGTLRDLARKTNRQNIRKALRSPVDPLAGRLPGRFIPDLSEFAEKISSTGAWQRSEGKNPEGGLNAKGRASLKAQGHDIKPGVKGPADTPEKLKRKGSFLSRMFGPGAPGSMKADNGEPSRRALSAKAWGEAVPSDDAGRARLYAKGQALLKRYEGKKKEAAEEQDAEEIRRKMETMATANKLFQAGRLAAYTNQAARLGMGLAAGEGLNAIDRLGPASTLAPPVAALGAYFTDRRRQHYADQLAALNAVAETPEDHAVKTAAFNAVIQAYELEKDAFSFSDTWRGLRDKVKTLGSRRSHTPAPAAPSAPKATLPPLYDFFNVQPPAPSVHPTLPVTPAQMAHVPGATRPNLPPTQAMHQPAPQSFTPQAPRASQRDYENISGVKNVNMGVGGMLAASPEGAFIHKDPKLRKMFDNAWQGHGIEEADALAHQLMQHQAGGGQMNAMQARLLMRRPEYAQMVQHMKTGARRHDVKTVLAHYGLLR